MKRKTELKLANLFRHLARYILLGLGIITILFALLSGAEDYGGGIDGILKNFPNALPWFLLLVVLYIAWNWEVVGGIIIIVFGLSVLYVFNFSTTNFLSIASILAFLIIILGAFFVLSWYFERESDHNKVF